MCYVKINFARAFGATFCLLTLFSFPAPSFGMESKLNETKIDSTEIKNHFLVRNYSEQEAFELVLGLAEFAPYFKSNGYDVYFPTHPIFKDLWENPEKVKILQVKNLDRGKYFKIFVSEVYESLDLVPVKKALTENSKILLMVMDRFNTLNKKWGFKIFQKYEITLTVWGPGGFYDSKFGKMGLSVDHKGFYEPNEYTPNGLTEIIVHELVHIGIETIIVREFKLSHWEKEGLVDLICELYFGDLLPEYKSQPKGDKKFREFVKYENIGNDLLETIRQYVLKYPRGA
jgi:hypothetical protein